MRVERRLEDYSNVEINFSYKALFWGCGFQSFTTIDTTIAIEHHNMSIEIKRDEAGSKRQRDKERAREKHRVNVRKN